MTVRLAVVVPAFDEATGIGSTLQALAAQTDRDFATVLVDNGSTDGTADIARRCADELGLELTVVDEPQKGTGAASDTGVRHALATGATHVLRTDADTLPAPGWVAGGRRAFAAGADLVTGPMRARTDEVRLRLWERLTLPAVIGFCQVFGRFRPSNRGPEFRGTYRMSPGCNLGVSARAYEASGGFPRTAIEDVHEDRELVNRVRRISDRVEYHPDLTVHASVRRLRAYGLVGTLRWYLDHGGSPTVVDVRGIPDDPPVPTSASRGCCRGHRLQPVRPAASSASRGSDRQARTNAGLRAPDPGTRSEARLLRAAHPGIADAVDRLVSRRPVVRVPGLGILVADPAAVRQALSDGDHFAKSGPGSSGALWTPVLGDRVLLNMDGADHHELRRRLADLFSARTVGTVIQETTTPRVEAARDALNAGRTVDVVTLAREVSAAAIARVVGIEPTGEHVEGLLRASDAIESFVSWRTKTLSPRQVSQARAHLEPIMAAAARAHASGDEGTVMGRMRASGTSAQEARSLAAALFLTGVGTVSSALPRIVGQLADARQLQPDTSRTDVAEIVREGLRMTTPSLATLRRCTADTELGGHPIRAGDRAVLLLWWATRMPDGFLPGRPHPPEIRHLWFGAGSHFCLGAPLALAELEAMTTMLLDSARAGGLEVVERIAARRVLVPRHAVFTVRAVQPPARATDSVAGEVGDRG